jgi:phage baseplate assembly protein W
MPSSKTYDFSSVGESATSYQKRVSTATSEAANPPIGIKTPLEIGLERDGLFRMHRNIEDTISDNLRNLLLTNHGERLFRYDYGANLRELVFELGTEEGDFEAINRIRNAVSTYLPFVNLQTFESVQTPQTYTEPSKVIIKVTYSVPGLNNKTRLIEVVLSTVS